MSGRQEGMLMGEHTDGLMLKITDEIVSQVPDHMGVSDKQ